VNDRWWVAALVYPAPLYAGLSVLVHFWSGGAAFPLGFLLVVAFGSATGFGLVRHAAWVWSGRAFFALAFFVPALYGGAANAVVLDFAGGVLAGLPFLWLEYAWRDTASPGARVVALQSALAVAVLELASITWFPVPTGAPGGWQFIWATGASALAQYQGIVALLAGKVVNAIPLESTLDLYFVVLGGLALAGVLASWASPRTSRLEPLPWSWARPRRSATVRAPTVEELGLRPGQREVLASRSAPSPPEGVSAPSSGPILVTALVVIGFLALAIEAPTFAVIVLVLATVGGLVAVGLALSLRLTPLGVLGA